MLIDPQRARDLKVEIFEQSTAIALEEELQEWLESREEEDLVGVDFDVDLTGPKYLAYVLYTE